MSWCPLPSQEFFEAQMTVFSLWVHRMRSTPYFLLSTVLVALPQQTDIVSHGQLALSQKPTLQDENGIKIKIKIKEYQEKINIDKSQKKKKTKKRADALAGDGVVDMNGLIITGCDEVFSRLVEIQRIDSRGLGGGWGAQ